MNLFHNPVVIVSDCGWQHSLICSQIVADNASLMDHPLAYNYESWLLIHRLFHCCCVYLACDSNIVATCLSIQLPTLLFVRVSFVLFLLFVVVSLVNQGRTKGEGRSTTN